MSKDEAVAVAPHHTLLQRLGRSITPDDRALAALWLLATAYNLFKPYHIDDAAHLLIAQWIAHHWLHPMRGLLNWSGVNEPIFKTNQPHLYFYALAVWGSLFGFSEPAMHALQSLATLAVIVLMYRISRRFVGGSALWAVAMLVLSPALFVEQNLMVDTPLLALWLWFFDALTDVARDRSQTVRFVIAAAACWAAILVKYSSLTLVPILAFALVFERRWRQLWVLFIPALAVAAWTGFNLWDYGAAHIATRSAGADQPRMDVMAGAWLITLGGITPMGLVWMAQVGAAEKAWRVGAGIAAGLAALAIAVALGWVTEHGSDTVLAFMFAENAAIILMVAAGRAVGVAWAPWWRRATALALAPRIYLVLWLAATSTFYVLYAPFIAARHALLIMPPAILLTQEALGEDLRRPARVFGIGLSLALSLALGVSDWRFADFYRVEARRVSELKPAAGQTLWADGHWGWQWYTARAGLPQIDVAASPVRPGDLIAVGVEADHQPIRRALDLKVIREDEETLPLLNLFCTGRPDSLYETRGDIGPWTLSRRCVNHVQVLRVDADDSDDQD